MRIYSGCRLEQVGETLYPETLTAGEAGRSRRFRLQTWKLGQCATITPLSRSSHGIEGNQPYNT